MQYIAETGNAIARGPSPQRAVLGRAGVRDRGRPPLLDRSRAPTAGRRGARRTSGAGCDARRAPAQPAADNGGGFAHRHLGALAALLRAARARLPRGRRAARCRPRCRRCGSCQRLFGGARRAVRVPDRARAAAAPAVGRGRPPGLLVAFQPMFGFISGAINNDNGVNAAAAAIAYLLIRGLRRGLTWRLGARARRRARDRAADEGHGLLPLSRWRRSALLGDARARARPAHAARRSARARRRLRRRHGRLGADRAASSGATLVTAPVGQRRHRRRARRSATRSATCRTSGSSSSRRSWPGMTNIYAPARARRSRSTSCAAGARSAGTRSCSRPGCLPSRSRCPRRRRARRGRRSCATGSPRGRLGWELARAARDPGLRLPGRRGRLRHRPSRGRPGAEQGRYIFPAAVSLAAAARLPASRSAAAGRVAGASCSRSP